MIDDPQTCSNLICELLILKRYVDHAMNQLERRTSLTRIELDILMFLADFPARNTATYIIENNQFSKSHVSGALKHLEHEGLVRKFFDGSNRKTTYLALTEKALPIVREGRMIRRDLLTRLTEGIDPERIQTAQDVLRSIFDNASHQEEKLHP